MTRSICRHVASVAIGLLGFVAVAEAGQELVTRVVVDTTTFDLAPSAGGGGAFHIRGLLCRETTLGDAKCTPIGTFHCWGWLTPDHGTFVSQEYQISGRGKLQIQGWEDVGPRAVAGGTGDFMRVRGEGTPDNSFFFGGIATGSIGLPEFLMTFDLEGVWN